MYVVTATILIILFKLATTLSTDKFHSCSRTSAHSDHYSKHIRKNSGTDFEITDGGSVGYRRAIGPWKRLKIQSFFDSAISNGNNIEITKRAFKRVEDRLKVSPITTRVNLTICPEKLTQSFEFEGHIAIWVYRAGENDTECANGAVAYSYNCYLSPIDRRPISGFINICDSWERYDEWERELVILHETFHLLGFAKEHFKNYPDSSKVMYKISPFRFSMYPDHRSTKIFRKDNIRRRKGGGIFDRAMRAGVRGYYLGLKESTNICREFFGCNELKGVELSKDMSHLSKLFFFDSFMSPIISGSSNVNCLLSYTILEESEWYIVNKEGLTMGNWMNGEGCDVFKMNCLDYWLHVKRENRWFCFDSIDECAIGKWENIPRKFIYDENRPYLGGVFGAEMEFCMIHKKDVIGI